MKKFISKVLICAMLISVLPKTNFAHEEKANSTTVSEKEKVKAEEKVEKKEETKAEEKAKQPVTASSTKARATEERYTVTFEFNPIPDSLELPEVVLALKPENKTDVANGTEIPLPKFDDVEVEGGKWKFLHWEAYPIIRGARNIIDGDTVTVNGSDLILLGKWIFEKTPEPDKYSVIFIFVSGTEGMDLPDEVLNKTPQLLTGIISGTEINLPTFEDVEVAGGTWKFTGWSLFPEARGAKSRNLGNTVIVDKDLELLGEWVFEKATPTYFIEFEFKSITDGKDLPQEVLNKLPEKQTDIPSNSTVTLPEMTDVKVDGGTWKFVRWTWAAYYRGTRDAGQDNFVYVDQDLLVTGEWEYVEDPEPEKFNVTFEFKSVTPGKELPDEIKAKLPPNQTDVDNGTVIPLEKYENVKVEGGTWVFNYWYIEKDGNQVIKENEAVVEGEDLNLIGEWAFEADNPEPEKYDVTFRFVSVTPGKELPQEVKDKLPPNQIGVDNGTLITLPILEDVKVDGGTWKFVKWLVEKEDGMHVVQAGPMVQDEDLKLVGEWKFEEDPKPEKYNVEFQFYSVTKGKELPDEIKAKLPANKTDVVNGTVIALPKYEDVKVEGGRWKFLGWYSIKGAEHNKVGNEVVVDNDNLYLLGQWKFEEDKKPQPPKPLKPQKPKVQKGRMLPKTNVESAFSYVILALAGIGGAYITKKKDNE